MKYTFNEEKHIHLLGDKPLCGVTTVLGVISKPALIQWSANMAVQYVKENLKDISDLNEVLESAKSAHRKKKEKAGDSGTIVHNAIESWIKGEPLPKLQDKYKDGLNQFISWARDNKVKFIESEKHLYSKDLWIGGIVDLVFEMDGKIYVGDIKTSKNVYPEMFAQMGAYDIMLQEMGHKPFDGYLIIHLPRVGKMDIIKTDHMELNRNYFKAALELYKIKQMVDGSIN